MQPLDRTDVEEPTPVGVFAPSFPPAFRAGGPVRSIDAVVKNAPERYRTRVLTPGSDMGHNFTEPIEMDRWLPHAQAKVQYISTRHPLAVLRSFRALRAEKPALLYFNSFFNPLFTVLPLFLWRLGFWGRPRAVIAPRGEFGDGALSRRALKKRVYLRVFRLLGLRSRVIWHATAAHEEEDIRDTWGSDARVLLRENDTQLPLEADRPASHSARVRAVYLGRIVEHKGLAVVLRALHSVDGALSLDIFGSEEDEKYARECHQIASTLPATVRVTFHGAVPHEDVRETLSGYDVLLMPTAGENFGHVIAEALSVSCAVLTTPWTPWTEVLQNGAGAVVPDRSPAAWASAIEGVVSLGAKEIETMRLTVARSYESWRSRPTQPHIFDLSTAQDARRPR